MAEHVLYNSWEYYDLSDEQIDDLIREFTDEPITDTMRWDYRADMRNDDWDDFMDECREIRDDFLVIADLGLWFGKRHAWKFCSNLTDAIRACLDGMDEFKIVEDDRGKLTIYGYHHDGTNVYELRRVTGEISSAISEATARKRSRNAHLQKMLGWI